jgi:site-specific DNA-methyltransferase (adenine-specific)
MRKTVREAFLAVREGRSPDVVIADPNVNARFLHECSARGLAEPALTLNLCLLNLRKTKDLEGIQSVRISVESQNAYRFGSEIAIRFMERKYLISLDEILCDPDRAAEFDAIANNIVPGFTAFQYRWAALNLRKSRKLQPELLAKVVPAEAIVTSPVAELEPASLPARPGLYLFFEPRETLYVGECQNLKKRLGKHLDHSDNKGLAQWLWQNGITDLHVEYQVLSAGTSTRIRKALEAELIISRHPVFNISGKPGRH